ncbi:YadA-like family protein [Burkholderia sp. MSMB1498]|uniref:YadA-like family protein n=1 Tax=Burkholderia sp. MSMB1498 TaxID=1637842 RepID=UPI0009E9B17B
MCSSIAPLVLGFPTDAFTADEAVTSPFNRDTSNGARGNLLDEIRRGVQLKHVSVPERNPNGSGGSAIAEMMRRAMNARFSAFELSPPPSPSPSTPWSDDESSPPTPIPTQPVSRLESAVITPHHPSFPSSPHVSVESPSPQPSNASSPRTPPSPLAMSSPSRESPESAFTHWPDPPTPLHESPERSPIASPHAASPVMYPDRTQRRPFALQKPPQGPSWRKRAVPGAHPGPQLSAQPIPAHLAAPASESAKYVAINSVSAGASATGTNAIAIGADARAPGHESLAHGRRAQAGGARSVAIGVGAIASGQNTVALGADSVADRDDTVSVGQRGRERQIVHVAPGTEPTDAVNVTQLRAAMSDTTAYTNRRIGDLQQSITDTARDAYSGVAAATALTMIPDVDRDKTLSIGVGGAVYKGHRAVALGGTARISENLKVRAGVAMSAGGNTVGVGMSWQW